MEEKPASDAETDADREIGPLRRCVATRVELPPSDLIRFVAAPDGVLVPDLACRLPGRGAWVTATHAAVEVAVRTKAFARSLKQPVVTRADLAEQVGALIERRVMDAFSLANKAGSLIAGFAQVEAALIRADMSALVHASDAAADGCQKLDRKFHAISLSHGRAAVIIDPLNIEQLSLAIGRANVVHAALIKGGATNRLLGEARRLVRYRPSPAVNCGSQDPSL